MIVNLLFNLADAAAIAVLLWIAMLMLGGYADDPQNFIIVFFGAVIYLGWRFL